MAQLYSLYVVYRDGRTLLQKDFKIENMEPDLVTGFLSAVSMFLSDLVGRICDDGQKLKSLEREDGRLRIIDREDVKILLEYGKNIYVAAFSTHDLAVIRQRMRALITMIEMSHEKLLENWLGDLSHFRDFVPLIDSLFRPLAVSERYVPVRVHTFPPSSLPQSLQPLLDAIDDNRSLEELSLVLQKPLFQIIVDFQALQDHHAIMLERRITVEQLVSSTPKARG
ncbi:MAG: hypothetical protein ACFFAL_03765 [Promethearchaeota archaeon]